MSSKGKTKPTKDTKGLILAGNFHLDIVSPSVHPILPLQPTSADGLLEGPTADSCEKGGSAMETNPNSALREEVQRYLRGCKDLVTAASSPRRFTIEEMAIIKYCEAEVGRISSASTGT
jgi:hypothetical protein